MNLHESTGDKWEKFLSPEVMQERLISASMYITAFELLKGSIIGRIRDFYSIGIDENGAIIGSEYQSRVLSRNKNALYASLNWLTENDVLCQTDLELFERIKSVRNKLAHELPSFVLGGAEPQLADHFPAVVNLLRKIEIWWVVNVEIPTNPDYDGQEIDDNGIVPGPVLMLELMLEVAKGNAEYLKHYQNARPDKKT